MAKDLSKKEINQLKEATDTFIAVVNALVDSGIVDYPYVRQNNRTGAWQKITVRLHLEDLTEAEAREIIEDQDLTNANSEEL